MTRHAQGGRRPSARASHLKETNMKHIFLAYLFLTSTALADSLDLKTAEQVLLNYSYSQKAEIAGVQAAHEGVVRKYGDILPTVELKSILQRHEDPRHSIIVTQPIPYPPQWFKEKEVLEITETVASKNQKLDRQSLVNTLRKLYFQIQFLDKKKTLALESFNLIERFHKESEQRFAKGFIPSSELKRSSLQMLELEKTLREINVQLDSSKKQLQLSLGRSDNNFDLKTDLEIGKSFLKSSETDLRAHIKQNSSETLAISKLQSESARLQTESFRYHYLPTFSLEAEVPFDQESRTTYQAKVTWNIFSGGTDRSDQRKLLRLKEQAEYSLQDTFVQFASNAEKALALLVEGRATYLQIKEGLKMWEEITASNQSRFQKGLISSKDLSDDITSYLTYATSYYQQTFDLLSNISDFCLLIGKEELFHTMLL